MLFNGRAVREGKLGVDNLNVALWVNGGRAVGALDAVVMEGAHYVADGVTFTDVSEKLVA